MNRTPRTSTRLTRPTPGQPDWREDDAFTLPLHAGPTTRGVSVQQANRWSRAR